MTKFTNKILNKLKGQKVGVFCDDSNLYHSYQKYGWRIDFEKFREFLEKFCDLRFIRYYIAIPRKQDHSYQGSQRFLERIKEYVELKIKPLKYIPDGKGLSKKADVDVEIVLDAVRTINDLDAAIIVSGDSDYLELKNYIIKDKKKKILFWAFEKNMAWELKYYCWHLYLDDFKKQIKLEKKQPPGLLPQNGITLRLRCY